MCGNGFGVRRRYRLRRCSCLYHTVLQRVSGRLVRLRLTVVGGDGIPAGGRDSRVLLAWSSHPPVRAAPSVLITHCATTVFDLLLCTATLFGWAPPWPPTHQRPTSRRSAPHCRHWIPIVIPEGQPHHCPAPARLALTLTHTPTRPAPPASRQPTSTSRTDHLSTTTPQPLHQRPPRPPTPHPLSYGELARPAPGPRSPPTQRPDGLHPTPTQPPHCNTPPSTTNGQHHQRHRRTPPHDPRTHHHTADSLRPMANRPTTAGAPARGARPTELLSARSRIQGMCRVARTSYNSAAAFTCITAA